jgi:hypothetical protein
VPELSPPFILYNVLKSCAMFSVSDSMVLEIFIIKNKQNTEKKRLKYCMNTIHFLN